MRNLGHADEMTLESLIDKSSLRAVIEALSNIAVQKAAHVEETWQDRPLANQWRRAGVVAFKCSQNSVIRNLP
jgi:hypothetical protein